MLKSFSLLYVEDDQSTIDAFIDAFSEYFKEVRTAKNGEEAWEMFIAQTPDIIVCDLQLPKLSGLDLIDRIRQINPTIPIIVNSAFSDTHLLLRSIELHVDSYILKPTDPYQLLHVMEKASRITLLENLLHTTQEMMQTIIDEIPDPILYINPDYTVMMLNKAAKILNPQVINETEKSVTCFTMSHHTDKPCNQSDHPCPIQYVKETKQATTVRHIHYNAEGEKRHIEVHMRPIFDEEGEIRAFLEVSHDVTDYLQIQDKLLAETEKLSHISLHDPLTQLPNRRLLNDRIEQAIEHRKRSGGKFALFFIDLDHFKEVNDSLGHLSGDQLLIEVAKRITQVTRSGDTVARIGGDEFVLIVENGTDILHFSHVAEKLKKLFNTPFLINGKKIYSACSIGIALYPNDGENAEILLSNADAAMYASKNSGRNKYHFYSPEFREQANNYLHLGTELKEAMQNNQFLLYFQPTLDVITNRCTSMEALIRWNHPKKGIISPADFLPIAQKSGLMSEIDYWVINQAIETFTEVCSSKYLNSSIAINITVETLLSPDFIEKLNHIILNHHLEPSQLILEIVETSLMLDITSAKKVIDQLHALNVRVAIDDFGTGYSSLSYILEMDIDILKIDQSFVRKIGSDEKGSPLIKSIIALSKIIEVKTIAEGVETIEQLKFLEENGIDIIQGYLYAKPMDQDHLVPFLKSCKEGAHP